MFTNGSVSPNETVNLLFAINNGVDFGVVPGFYLRVEAQQILEPATLGMATLALIGFAARGDTRARNGVDYCVPVRRRAIVAHAVVEMC